VTPRGRARRLTRAEFACVVLVGVAWVLLETYVPLRAGAVQHAGVFAAIVTAVQILWQALQAAGTAIATTLVGAVSYLSAALAWLAKRVAEILLNTGKMFAKVWDYGRGVYQDVLKPFLQWIHTLYERLKTWLTKYVGPVLKFLERVRTKLLGFYKKFVRPILDIIDATRAVLRVLGDLGVDWARALDAKFGEWEAVINQRFRTVLFYINSIIDVIDSVITPDRLLQRLTFLGTLERDILYASRAIVNIRNSPVGGGDYQRVHDELKIRDNPDIVADVRDSVQFNGGGYDTFVGEQAAQWRIYLSET
jgi:hypothetical protein